MGCADRTCSAANELRADHEPVSGATVEALMAALEAQPFGEVPLAWRDGPQTTATGSLEIVPGTATRVQRADCLQECRTSSRLTLTCDPDKLSVEARATASTADGRVVDAEWTGHVFVTALEGPLDWQFFPEPVSFAELDGTLDPTAVAEMMDDVRDLGLRAFLYGTDGVLESVSFDVAFTRGEGELEASGAAALGGSP